VPMANELVYDGLTDSTKLCFDATIEVKAVVDDHHSI